MSAADQQEQTLEVAGKVQEGRQRIPVESALSQRQQQRRQATRIQTCSLLGVIGVVRARPGRLLPSLKEMCSHLLGMAGVIVVVRLGWRREE